MSAQVIDFAAIAARKGRRAPSRPPSALMHDFTFWSGASGLRYVHTIFKLLDCPEIPNANVILARRGSNGQVQALYVGRLEEDAPSLNLAELRRTSALIGANEVHVHLLATTEDQRRHIETDLNGAEALVPGGLATVH